MTEKEFKESYDGASIDSEELAGIAQIVDGELGKLARRLVQAQCEFESYLDSIDYQVG